MERYETVIGKFIELDLEIPLRKRLPQLFLHALAFSLLGFMLPHFMGLKASGFISIFLVAASLRDCMQHLLEENRSKIWEDQESSWEVNKRTSLSFIAVFLGIFSAYTMIAIPYSQQELGHIFQFVGNLAALEHGASLTDPHRFVGFLPIFLNNLRVLLCILVLTFFYRAYGAMLVLCWNAVVWAVALNILGMRGIDATEANPIVFFLVAGAAILPHLMTEASAYCLAALSAIFISHGVAKYSITDQRLRQVLWATLQLLLLGILLLIIGAGLEVFWASKTLSIL